MPNIKVDDEVYEHLQSLATPFVDKPNDVLRRLLFETLATAGPPSISMPSRRPGALMPFIDEDMMKAGNTLSYRQTRKRKTYTAIVTPDGWIEVDGVDFSAPSPALKHCVGHDINGWNWRHDQSETLLNTMREELEAR